MNYRDTKNGSQKEKKKYCLASLEKKEKEVNKRKTTLSTSLAIIL